MTWQNCLTFWKLRARPSPQDVRRAGELTRYAVETRHPDQVPLPTDEDLAYAVEVAESVVRWAEGRVSAGG